MAHTLRPIPAVEITDLTPGATKTITITVDAEQPPSTASGTVTAEFNGETVTAPINITYNTGPIVPTLAVDLSGVSNLSVSVGAPVRRTGWPTLWDIPVTLTAV